MKDPVVSINQSVVEIMNTIKDNIRLTLANALSAGDIKIEPQMLERISTLAVTAADAAFYRAHPHFERNLKNILSK